MVFMWICISVVYLIVGSLSSGFLKERARIHNPNMRDCSDGWIEDRIGRIVFWPLELGVFIGQVIARLTCEERKR